MTLWAFYIPLCVEDAKKFLELRFKLFSPPPLLGTFARLLAVSKAMSTLIRIHLKTAFSIKNALRPH